MKVRDEKTKQLFIKYLEEHPDERFMQAVRNFIGAPFLVVSNTTPKEGDTFYWECDKLLEEDREDYIPVEPLIRDEKIRKAVRAWADLCGYKFVTHRFYTTTTDHRWSLLARESQEISLPEIDELDEAKDYTIEELCGEEE